VWGYENLKVIEQIQLPMPVELNIDSIWFNHLKLYWCLVFKRYINLYKTLLNLFSFKTNLLSCLNLWFFLLPKTLRTYLAFQSFELERTGWILFQKHVMRTKLDIYNFIDIFLLHVSWNDCLFHRKISRMQSH
jgi:hypothetical protein